MKLKSTTVRAIMASAAILALPMLATSCGGSSAADKEKTEQDSTDMKGYRPMIDKSEDAALQTMIKDVAPQFKQYEYKDAVTGKTMKYNLYTPKNIEANKKYPLVLYISDASTVGEDATTPLTRGYGALVWATDESQAKNPCYVLVPQFSQVAINDDYKCTDEVDIALRLMKDAATENNVDQSRIYSTGQSMGGMISMYYDVKYPDTFAASIFVDCKGDTDSFDQLVKHKYVYFIAGHEGKAYKCMEPMEEAARKEGVQYTYAEWSAKLPETTQNDLARTMLEKGAPVNIFVFEPKTVLPESGEGSEHMYSFDYAYRIATVRDWLFQQKK